MVCGLRAVGVSFRPGELKSKALRLIKKQGHSLSFQFPHEGFARFSQEPQWLFLQIRPLPLIKKRSVSWGYLFAFVCCVSDSVAYLWRSEDSSPATLLRVPKTKVGWLGSGLVVSTISH